MQLRLSQKLAEPYNGTLHFSILVEVFADTARRYSKVETGFLADQPSSSSSESDGDSSAKDPVKKKKKKKDKVQSSSGSGSDARDKGKVVAEVQNRDTVNRSANPASDDQAAKTRSRPARNQAAAPKPGHTAQK